MHLDRITGFYCFVHLLSLTKADYNFSPYPLCAQTYLYQFASPKCDQGNDDFNQLYLTNNCLCNDATFLDASARGIYQNCGCAVLLQTANFMVNACTLSGVIPKYDAAQYIAAGDGGQSTCADQSMTSSQRASQEATTSYVAPTSTYEPSEITTSASFRTVTTQSSAPSAGTPQAGADDGSGQAQNASDESIWLQKTANRIALGVGLGLGIPTLLVGIWACLSR